MIGRATPFSRNEEGIYKLSRSVIFCIPSNQSQIKSTRALRRPKIRRKNGPAFQLIFTHKKEKLIFFPKFLFQTQKRNGLIKKD